MNLLKLQPKVTDTKHQLIDHQFQINRLIDLLRDFIVSKKDYPVPKREYQFNRSKPNRLACQQIRLNYTNDFYS